ncbi:scavenger receptor class B member 1 [Glossina fuscipes]|uniref:Scavenger receptor class B member 1 n=1 Tax=Glossina fuscipes TaxID=7396 RepID=A0A8U0W9L3_9MUSC|nr:scavenger receptor class B member 1 [Glossina fuscipes]
MKEISKFSSQRYSIVNSDDCDYNDSKSQNQQQQQHQQQQQLQQQQNVASNNETKKSLKNNCRSVGCSDVLNSFFHQRRQNKRARPPKRSFLLLVLGILAICIAILCKIVHPYDMIFNWKLIMRENNEMFDLWAKPPIDLYIKIYLFNITNAEAFLAGREKMNVQQVGPYVYRELFTHENVTFNANDTMSALPRHPLVWQEHLSEGNKEDDPVVMLNIAMLAISHLTADRNIIVRLSLNSLFSTLKSEPIVRMTAKEFMFGYNTKLISLGNTFLPNWIYFDKVGIIDRMYDFDSDYETFYTGRSDPSLSGLYATYRGNTDLPNWPEKHCSNIEMASDGSKFRSFIKPNDTLKFFRKSMCRPIHLVRADTDIVNKRGLKGYRYRFEDNAFDNGRYNVENKCFCRKGNSLQQSGLPLSLTAKVQINLHFKNMRAFRQLQAFSYQTIPTLWFDITMPQLPDEMNLLFSMYLNVLPYAEPIIFWSCSIIGFTLVFYAITRATLRMSNLGHSTHISDGNRYGKANLLNSQNGVYKSCELKQIEGKEKSRLLPGETYARSNVNEEYCEKEESNRARSYILDLEPTALSASDCGSNTGSSSNDEGNDSDTATMTISRNSSSSSCMGMQISNKSNDHNNDDVEKQTIISFTSSSGYDTSITES